MYHPLTIEGRYLDIEIVVVCAEAGPHFAAPPVELPH
jgi:hypothetical protein